MFHSVEAARIAIYIFLPAAQLTWAGRPCHGLLLPRLFGFPATAEGFVEGDEIGRDVLLALDHLILRGKQITLGI